MKVLHVTESYGGGVLTAISSYVSATPHHDHFLAYRPREGEYLPNTESELFCSTHPLPGGVVQPFLAVRELVKQVDPDVIHAHSSFGGLFVRMSIGRQRRRIVYTPHCYAFERRDLPMASRVSYFLAEAVQQWNTSITAACSERELQLARRLGAGRKRCVLVPNCVTEFQRARLTKISETRGDGGGFDLVGMGRICPQKDVEFFAAVVDRVRAYLPEVSACWIGGGENDQIELLRDQGICVSGWVDAATAGGILAGAGVYIHSAVWEGFPMSILEAHAVGVPVLVRDIGAFGHIGREVKARTEQEMAGRAIEILMQGSDARMECVDRWARILVAHNEVEQSRALQNAYEG